MFIPMISSVFHPVLLADSNGIAIFIIIAIIFGIVKLVGFINNKTAEASNDPNDIPEDMSDLIKRVLKQEKQGTREDAYTPPPIETKHQQAPPPQQIYVPKPQPVQRADVFAPNMSPSEAIMEAAPAYTHADPAPLQPDYEAVRQSPVPKPAYAPTRHSFDNLDSNDIEANVRRMAMSVEESAQSAINQAYNSAEKGYSDTLEQLEKLNEAVRAKTAALPRSVVEMPRISLTSLEQTRNAILMKEVMGSPKGLQ